MNTTDYCRALHCTEPARFKIAYRRRLAGSEFHLDLTTYLCHEHQAGEFPFTGCTVLAVEPFVRRTR